MSDVKALIEQLNTEAEWPNPYHKADLLRAAASSLSALLTEVERLTKERDEARAAVQQYLRAYGLIDTVPPSDPSQSVGEPRK
jgi:hypothetical protein